MCQSCTLAEVGETIEEVCRGERVFKVPVLPQHLSEWLNEWKAPEQQLPTAALTERERRIVELVGEGMLSKEIAHVLGLSVRTVDKHWETACRKLNLRGLGALARCASQQQLIRQTREMAFLHSFTRNAKFDFCENGSLNRLGTSSRIGELLFETSESAVSFTKSTESYNRHQWRSKLYWLLSSIALIERRPTMRYKMQQKLWSFGDDFTIQDDRGNDVFRVDGKAFSFGDKLSFQDLSGNELAYIAQKVFSLKKTYELYRRGQMFAQVQKEWTFFKDKYTVDVPGPNDYEVTGSFFDHEYSFNRQGREVAHVSKRFFSWSDAYGIDIVEGEDDITILATAVIIDLVCDSKDG